MDIQKESLKILADLALRVLSTELFYIPKFVDEFEKLEEPVQIAFLNYMVESVGNDEWLRLYTDGNYRLLLTYILFCFTGNSLRGEPSKDKLAGDIRDFVKSEYFKKAIREAKTLVLMEGIL